MPAPHLVWVFPGFGIGGAQVRFAALANHLGLACRHTVLALNRDTSCTEKLAPGHGVDLADAGHQPGRMARAVLHARRALVAQRPDCVVTSNWGAIEWAIGARLAGLRHVHTEDGFGPEERSSQILRRVLVRRLALRGSDVVLPSRTLALIARARWRLPPCRLHTIPNGIDLARFAGAERMALPAGEGPVIGTVAALRPEKNIARLLRAFAACARDRPARLVVVGDGAERAELEALAAALGIADRTLFAGHSAQPERWLASFDVFALSSDTEQMPLSLLEAMAAGLPAVCTDVGDVAAMLSAANAAFVSPPEDIAFAAALRRVLDAPGAPVGRANRAKAEAEFSQQAMFARWEALLGCPGP